MKKFLLQICFLIAFNLLSASCLHACNVPVFRYALERWPSEVWTIYLPGNSTTFSQKNEIFSFLQPHSNQHEVCYNFQLVFRKNSSPGDEPILQLVSPYSPDSPILECPATVDAANTLIDSPLRRQIAQKLLDGQTAVWLLLESGNPGQDNPTFTFLQSQLQKLQATLQLPDFNPNSHIPIELDEAAQDLTIHFSALRLSRNDPAEMALVSQLLHSEPDLIHYPDQTILFPIFGRGRVLYALVGEGITQETISEAASFITGPCSCIIKDLNPGIDLLMPVHWDTALQNPMIRDTEPQYALPFENLTRKTTEQPQKNKYKTTILIAFALFILVDILFVIYFFTKKSNR
jgi:hypothetical protein